VLVPFAFGPEGVANRRAQLDAVRVDPALEFDFKPVRFGPSQFDSHHDFMLADLAMVEAGLTAAAEGYDAICLDTVSDSGASALRGMLDIPVIAPGKAGYLTAMMLGRRFSVITTWVGWEPLLHKGVQEYGLESACASVRSLGDTTPDVERLFTGKEEELFPRLTELCRLCLGDGADVICLGSTTMHQAHAHLAEALPVPVINPGPLSYKLTETMLALGLRQSRSAYPRPADPKAAEIHAMLAAAEAAAR
jgi:allantoin racemase